MNSIVWEDDPKSLTTPERIWADVEQATVDMLTGKMFGPLTTFAGDGLHKLYELIWEVKFRGLKRDNPTLPEEKVKGPAYGAAHKEFIGYLRKITQSTIPYVVCTAWTEREKDDPDNKDRNAPSHLWANLPGTLAQQVVGEFPAVLGCEAGTLLAPGKFTQGKWQIRPSGKVWGVGIKLPAEISSKLPTHVPADWQALEKLVFGE